MADPLATLYFDFPDPLSWLVELELQALPDGVGARVARAAYELRPPPAPLTVPGDAELAARWSAARRAADDLGIQLDQPALVPWSRKAHELHLYAATKDVAAEVRTGVFRAFFEDGRDIGRVDVLVEVGRAAGLDLTETKAVLDVDRFAGEVAAGRAHATARAVTDTPELVRDGARLQGFHNRAVLGTFLRES
jgi:predicted DsbA family dithiol-disulfide isomerase